LIGTTTTLYSEEQMAKTGRAQLIAGLNEDWRTQARSWPRTPE
jgi:hypothetical protein